MCLSKSVVFELSFENWSISPTILTMSNLVLPKPLCNRKTGISNLGLQCQSIGDLHGDHTYLWFH